MMYTNKINDLISAMEKAEFSVFDGDKDEAISFITENIQHMLDYVNTVVHYQHMIPMLSFRYEGEEYRTRVMELDTRRRNVHNCAIDAINIINRMAKMHNMEDIFCVDTNDRYAVADAIGDYVIEAYRLGTQHSGMDGAVDAITKSGNPLE